MTWVGHVARIVEKRNACWVLVEKPAVNTPPEHVDLDGRILQYI
jgi:hypothetical protein